MINPHVIVSLLRESNHCIAGKMYSLHTEKLDVLGVYVVFAKLDVVAP